METKKRGGWKLNLTEEQREKRREIGRTRKGNYSTETRKKMSDARLGMKFSEEHRENLRKAWRHRLPDSEETIRRKKDSALKGENNGNWKGGFSKRNGRLVRNEGQKYNYRIVAERILGRPLKEKEVIHHINENKDDDRLENLFLFRTTGAHSTWHLHLRRYGKDLDGSILKSNLELYSVK